MAQALTIYKSLNENNKGRSFVKTKEDSDFSEAPLDLIGLTHETPISASNVPISGDIYENKKKEE